MLCYVMIEVFKIMKGVTSVRVEDMFEFVCNENGIWGHNMKLFKGRCN